MCAEAIRLLEFYVCHTDGKPHSFGARCAENLNDIDRVDEFVAELNAAIEPVRQKWMDEILQGVKDNFPNPQIANGDR